MFGDRCKDSLALEPVIPVGPLHALDETLFSKDMLRSPVRGLGDPALLRSVIVGFTMLVFTVLAMVIIDRFGRRNLMIAGSLGYIAGLSGAAWAFYAKVEGSLLLVSLLVFIAAHGFGQGAVIWVFISEIFPNRVRARGQALGSFTHWAMNAGISWTFPMIAAAAGWMAFTFYALCMVGQLAWVLLVMPETKGVSLEKIQEKLGIE